VDQLPPPPSDIPVALPSEPTPPTTPPSGGKRWLVIGLVVLLVIGGIAVAVALGGGSDTPTGEQSSSQSATGPVQPNPPGQLKASAGAFTVKLTWRPGTGDGALADHYDIMRGAKIVGHADGDATSFLDDTVVPKQIYDYQVIAISAEGTRLGATVRTQTPGAPPGTATLAGVFNVKVHPTSHSGFSSFDEKDRSAGWRFVPSCKQPPCDTQLRDLGLKEFQIQLKRTEGTYTGSESVPGLVSCNGHDVSTSITVTIHATQADAVGEGWRITKFTGTMSQYSSSQLGCTSSSARFDVTGSLTKG
jgi:hypothetical protein